MAAYRCNYSPSIQSSRGKVGPKGCKPISSEHNPHCNPWGAKQPCKSPTKKNNGQRSRQVEKVNTKHKLNLKTIIFEHQTLELNKQPLTIDSKLIWLSKVMKCHSYDFYFEQYLEHKDHSFLVFTTTIFISQLLYGHGVLRQFYPS